MTDISLRIVDTHGISHNLKFPWSSEQVYAVAERGVGRALILGLLHNGPFDLHVTELSSELPVIRNIVRYKQAGYKVVYANNDITAVKLLFDNDLTKAYEDVFTPFEMSTEDDNEFRSVVTWYSILDMMKSHDHFKQLGNGFYADTVGA
ncbi:LtrC-like protein [Weissella oryzae SG25]|uniref:LtrC-like protein n=1 Tax=Weissella oryzae (strain DSM 25784 / JCM 18191 / LMG 30913 / SG25) TaxID=1329250 RepID=A0A069CVT0_WEIOS|nr:hypothetical protein [Weissella oryzae]GAK31895.1 LtrC-like protein [Weissella oryzae SG25]